MKKFDELIHALTAEDVPPSDWYEAYDVLEAAYVRKTPKKPIKTTEENTNRCPYCYEFLIGHTCYCPDCGQRLDWSEEYDTD